MSDSVGEVIVGVDTHAEVHVAVAIDAHGRILGELSVSTDRAGSIQLWQWAQSWGNCRRVGIEGTSSYGVGVTSFLRGEGVEVIEVMRPNRQHRRRHGKSDLTDALGAARAVLSGEATAIAKDHTGIVESIRVTQLTRRGMIRDRTACGNRMRDLITTADDSIRDQFRGLTPRRRAQTAADWHDTPGVDPLTVTRRGLRRLGHQWIELNSAIGELYTELADLTNRAVPTLLAESGVGPDVAAKLVMAAGQNPQRCNTEAAFAALCGTSPIPASSGKTHRHRLNRGGDRQANNALWTVALVRARVHPETQAYVTRRTAEGLTHREINRCLKRALARRFYPIIVKDLARLT